MKSDPAPTTQEVPEIQTEPGLLKLQAIQKNTW